MGTKLPPSRVLSVSAVPGGTEDNVRASPSGSLIRLQKTYESASSNVLSATAGGSLTGIIVSETRAVSEELAKPS